MSNTDTRELLHSSMSNEWYTPAVYVEAARELLGAIDLDPASSADANRTIRAECFYTAVDDGLSRPWKGRVFLNPPYGKEGGKSNQARWSERLLAEYRAGNVTAAILLVNAVPGNRWFLPLCDNLICFVSGRIYFERPDGTPATSPTHSNCFMYLGPQPGRFITIFERFGPVLRRAEKDQAA